MPAEVLDLAAARARYALQQVQGWKHPREAVQLVKGLPVTVRTLGLAQAVALLVRRGAGAHDLAENLAGWLLREAPEQPLGAGGADALTLVERLVAAAPQAARAAEEEAIQFLSTLKLFGELVVHG